MYLRSKFLCSIAAACRGTLILWSLAALSHVHADEVDSIFMPQGRNASWGDAEHWMPAIVPDNIEASTFNVTIDGGSLNLEAEYTIDNLVLQGGVVTLASLDAEQQSRRTGVDVNGTTRILNATSTTEDTLVVIKGFSSNFAADTSIHLGNLANFSAASGTLADCRFSVDGADAESILSFNGADIRTNQAVFLLSGPQGRITDENGNDAFRNLSVNEGTLFIEQRTLTLLSSLENRNLIELKSVVKGLVAGEREIDGEIAMLDLPGGLTNFDAASRTLTGGVFRISDASVMQFPGADIVDLDGEIRVEYSASIRDSGPNGVDALRNLRRISGDGELYVTGRSFPVLGDLTVDGSLHFVGNSPLFAITPDDITLEVPGTLQNNGFISISSANADVATNLEVTGNFANYDPASKSLTGGRIELNSSPIGNGTSDPVSFIFPGADVVVNASELTLIGNVSVTSSDGPAGLHGLRNLNRNAAEGVLALSLEGRSFTTAGEFENDGLLVVGGTFGASPFVTAPGSSFINRGTVRIDRSATLVTSSGGVFRNLEGGILGGMGSISGDVENSGILDPVSEVVGGSSPATLTFGSNLTLTPTSEIRIGVRGINPGSGYDQIIANAGPLALAGKLSIEILPPQFTFLAQFVPKPEDSFQLIVSEAGFTGAFSNVANGARLATSDGSGSFLVSYSDQNITLTDFQVNPQFTSTITSISLTPDSVTLTWTPNTGSSTYSVEASPTLAPGSWATRATTNGATTATFLRVDPAKQFFRVSTP